MKPYDERLRQLLDTAAVTFAERGFHGTSMRDLSRASGLSLAGLYHYVDSKTELLFLIQDRCFAEVIAGARTALADVDGAEERLRTFIRHHVGFFAAHMNEMKVLAHEEDELSGTMRDAVRQRKREYVALLFGLLEAAGGEPEHRQVAAYALFGMMNWIYTWYHPGGALPPARLASDMADLFLNGYLTPTHAAAPMAASHGG
jgi:AcrR family transcriptional regulator